MHGERNDKIPATKEIPMFKSIPVPISGPLFLSHRMGKVTKSSTDEQLTVAPTYPIIYNRDVSRRTPATRVFLATVLMIVNLAMLSAKQASWVTGASNPGDLVVQLVTIEPGDELYTWWGHSAIIVTDTRLNESRFYNYGLFSFEQTNFAANFAMGRLWFAVGAYPTSRALEEYKRLNRSIIIQTLNIPPELRIRIAGFVENNILPENREYLYDHYYDNCATRIRDILDTASVGRLKKASEVSANTTFRRVTRRFSGGRFLMDTLLMFLMGNVIDDPITVWETMFLPTELAEVIEQISVPGESGKMEPFVTETVLWFQSAGRDKVPERAPPAIPASLALGGGIGLAITAVCLLLRNRNKTGRVFFGVISALTGLVIGLPGTVLTLILLFTDHTVTYGNENLAFSNPLTFFAFPLGILAAFGLRRNEKVTAWLWIILLAIAVVYIIMKPLPFFIQDNWQIVALLLPVLAALAFAGWRRLKAT
jgi:hypothetical protein